MKKAFLIPSVLFACIFLTVIAILPISAQADGGDDAVPRAAFDTAYYDGSASTNPIYSIGTNGDGGFSYGTLDPEGGTYVVQMGTAFETPAETEEDKGCGAMMIAPLGMIAVVALGAAACCKRRKISK